MPKKQAEKRKKKALIKNSVAVEKIENILDFSDYNEILNDLVNIVQDARHTVVNTVNAIMTATYWKMGRRIIESEQKGRERANYGEDLLKQLSLDLTSKLGRGFSRQNLQRMRKFYLKYPPDSICSTVSSKLDKNETQIIDFNKVTLQFLSKTFPLSWSHYVTLLSVKKDEARSFYEAEALRGGWSIRQLERQVSSQFYERTLLSRNKAAMLKKGSRQLPEDMVTPEEEIKDPLVLEFLNLKDEYSESALEEALILHLESFLLELGFDFAFIGRQRRLRIGDTWYRVDLLFFHRRLRCLIIVDLKVGKFTHSDMGQMYLYINYAKEHWAHPHENPPIGLILCAQKDESVAHYALEGMNNKILTAEYRMDLPDEKILVEELEKTKKVIEDRLQKAKKQNI